MSTHKTSSRDDAAWNPPTSGSNWKGVVGATEGEAGAPTANPHDVHKGYLTHIERRLLGVRDRKLRRCWFCGEWAYDAQDCTVCAAPVNKADLGSVAG